jgi:hypothetical protein
MEFIKGKRMSIMFSQKRTGEGAASAEEIEEFNTVCKDNEVEMFKVCVTDDEHELLSLDSNVLFMNSKNAKVYNTVMEAYNDTVDFSSQNDHNIYAQMFVLLSDKFDQNEEARRVLMSVKDYDLIIYKTDDENYWGARVPEFVGQNIAGQIMVELRDYYIENKL